jgi:fission process protein 1
MTKDSKEPEAPEVKPIFSTEKPAVKEEKKEEAIEIIEAAKERKEEKGKKATAANQIKSKLTNDDLLVLLKYYDTDKDGIISKDEAAKIIEDCKKAKFVGVEPEVVAIIKKYDTDGDGSIDEEEIKAITHDVDLVTDTNLRYLGYAAVVTRLLPRAFRYLAFTSDFGEALRPVLSARIVTGTYAIAIGYCFADVGWEAYKLKERNYMTAAHEHHPPRPMSMTQLVVERSVFQAVASVAVPFAIIHTAVGTSKKFFDRMGRFTKWGPSVVGLAVIPLLPMYFDEPIEHGLELSFAKWGPWSAKKEHKD